METGERGITDIYFFSSQLSSTKHVMLEIRMWNAGTPVSQQIQSCKTKRQESYEGCFCCRVPTNQLPVTILIYGILHFTF